MLKSGWADGNAALSNLWTIQTTHNADHPCELDRPAARSHRLQHAVLHHLQCSHKLYKDANQVRSSLRNSATRSLWG